MADLQTIKDRLKIFAQTENLTHAQFEVGCGLSNGYLASKTKGLNSEKIHMILSAYPKLNKYWLLFGEGDMYVDSNTYIPLSDVEIVNDDDVTCSGCGYRIPFVPDNIIKSPNVKIKDFVNDTDNLKFSSLRELIGDDVHYYQRVITSAMAPDFLPGDILLIKFIPVENVISGGIYLLDSKSKGCLVRQIDMEETTFSLHASNPDFRDVTMPREDVYGFGRIVCQLRTNFNIAPSNITNQQLLIDKSSQIDKLIDGQTQLIVGQNRLIDEIVKQNERQNNLIELITKKS